MAHCTTNQHTSNNRKAKSMGNGITAYQDACLVKSRRLQGETGQKGNRKATVVLGRMERSRAELDRAEARLKQGYCREAFLAACAARKEFRDAEAQWNSYR